MDDLNDMTAQSAASIRSNRDAEIERLLTGLRVLRLYFNKHQLQTPLLQFFREHLPNLAHIGDVKNGDYQVQLKHLLHHISIAYPHSMKTSADNLNTRGFEDLWQQVFPVGTEWDQLDLVYQYKWNFSNLENAFKEGGELYGKKVYLFGCTEPQLVFFSGQGKVTVIPVVVAVESPFPPSDKIGINSVQREVEEIIPMKQMKMDWVPYIPLENRDSQVERLKSQIFILSCTQRRAGLKQMKLDRVKKFEYCLPYFYQPFKEDELEQSTIVPIIFPAEPKPVFTEFDWEFDEVEEFIDKLIEEEELSADQKDAFKDFLKEKVREAKKANREAREARKKAIEEMSEETKTAFEKMKFYKFYPVSSPDTPDVSDVKSPFINMYCGKAHKVL